MQLQVQLVHAEGGRLVVQVTGWNGDQCLGSALGEAGNAEEAEDRALATTAHAAWVNFVKSGTPSAPGLPAWPRYEPQRRQVMVLGYQPALASDPLREERVLWDDTYA